MNSIIELALAVGLLYVLYDKPHMFNGFINSILGKVLFIILIACIAKTRGFVFGLLVAMILLIYYSEETFIEGATGSKDDDIKLYTCQLQNGDRFAYDNSYNMNFQCPEALRISNRTRQLKGELPTTNHTFYADNSNNLYLTKNACHLNGGGRCDNTYNFIPTTYLYTGCGAGTSKEPGYAYQNKLDRSIQCQQPCGWSKKILIGSMPLKPTKLYYNDTTPELLYTKDCENCSSHWNFIPYKPPTIISYDTSKSACPDETKESFTTRTRDVRLQEAFNTEGYRNTIKSMQQINGHTNN